jgi:hypothetical protein
VQEFRSEVGGLLSKKQRAKKFLLLTFFGGE